MIEVTTQLHLVPRSCNSTFPYVLMELYLVKHRDFIYKTFLMF